ncbi:MAG: RNA polymerase factor sigma-32 [Bdellovibrio sp.]|nr:RNA polymerase factor sigma-32 [Bdellovibrio sp.]
MTAKKVKKKRGIAPEVLPAEETPSKAGNRDLEANWKEVESDPDSDDQVDEESDEPAEPDESEEETDSSQLPSEYPKSNLDREMKAVSPQDPLRRYMEEVRRYPLLEPAEEFALVARLRNAGDLEAAKALVSANLRLVVKIAFEYRTYYSNLLDLIQEGNIGLMKAVSKFDPTKGARLGYYASWWIRSYILKYLLDNFRLVRVGTTQAQKKLFYHLMREKERLEAQGLLAGPKLLAQKLNVREKDVVEMEQRLSGRGAEMSLDAPIDDGDTGKKTSHLDLLEDSGELADEALSRDQLLTLLKARLPDFQKGLNERERKVLKDRILSEEPKTLQEVADLYGLTRERTRQIEAKVIEKLREFLKPDLEPKKG